jgi:hypothetical protein
MLLTQEERYMILSCDSSFIKSILSHERRVKIEFVFSVEILSTLEAASQLRRRDSLYKQFNIQHTLDLFLSLKTSTLP